MLVPVQPCHVASNVVEHVAGLGGPGTARHKIPATTGVCLVAILGGNSPVILCAINACRATIVAYNFFADGFGKVADIAVRSKGTPMQCV